jgi:hypothetical protein
MTRPLPMGGTSVHVKSPLAAIASSKSMVFGPGAPLMTTVMHHGSVPTRVVAAVGRDVGGAGAGGGTAGLVLYRWAEVAAGLICFGPSSGVPGGFLAAGRWQQRARPRRSAAARPPRTLTVNAGAQGPGLGVGLAGDADSAVGCSRAARQQCQRGRQQQGSRRCQPAPRQGWGGLHGARPAD